MVLDPAKSDLELIQGAESATTYPAAARTVSTVGRAAVGRQQEHAVRISLDEVRRDGMRFFGQGIRRIQRHRHRLGQARYTLDPNRIIGIVRVDQRPIIWRAPQTETICLRLLDAT